MEALVNNNMAVDFVKTTQEAKEKALALISKDASIGLGGSTTVKQIGLLDELRNGSYNLIDAYEQGIPREESVERRRKGLLADYFITGTNAITENGELVNMDGFGNRVAGQIFGPNNVIIITSVSKIVKDVHAAVERIKDVAAPKNANRFGTEPPCTKNEPCDDCPPDLRLCNVLTIIMRQAVKDRIQIILVEDETLGF